MSGHNTKKDTPIKKTPNSNKEPTISDVWNLLISMQSTVSSDDTQLKNLNKNLFNLENNFSSSQTAMKNLHTEIS